MSRRLRLSFALALACTAIAPHAHATPARPDGPGTTFTTASGAKIWYDVRGTAKGRPLVMVNGGPGFDHQYVLCSDAWDQLARSRRVVFYDQRGNGLSGQLTAGQSCTLADQIDDLDALRAELHAERIDLLGHSWGGYLVMAYAARHPERVAHLTIVDSAAPKWSDTEFIFKNIFPEGVERQGSLDFFDALGDSAAAKASLDEYLAMLFVSET
jgi:proline iminopeptidase